MTTAKNGNILFYFLSDRDASDYWSNETWSVNITGGVAGQTVYVEKFGGGKIAVGVLDNNGNYNLYNQPFQTVGHFNQVWYVDNNLLGALDFTVIPPPNTVTTPLAQVTAAPASTPTPVVNISSGWLDDTTFGVSNMLLVVGVVGIGIYMMSKGGR
jgi:hypothetical protein